MSNTFLNSTRDGLVRIEKPDQEIEGGAISKVESTRVILVPNGVVLLRGCSGLSNLLFWLVIKKVKYHSVIDCEKMPWQTWGKTWQVVFIKVKLSMRWGFPCSCQICLHKIKMRHINRYWARGDNNYFITVVREIILFLKTK